MIFPNLIFFPEENYTLFVRRNKVILMISFVYIIGALGVTNNIAIVKAEEEMRDWESCLSHNGSHTCGVLMLPTLHENKVQPCALYKPSRRESEGGNEQRHKTLRGGRQDRSLNDCVQGTEKLQHTHNYLRPGGHRPELEPNHVCRFLFYFILYFAYTSIAPHENEAKPR